MNIGQIVSAITTNPTLKTLFGLVKDMVPAGIMDWYFMGKLARRNTDGTRKPHEYEDEAEYRRVAAKLRSQLAAAGRSEEALVDAVDALMADLPAREAFIFRECLRLTKGEDEKLLIFTDVAKAPPEAQLAKIRAISQQPAMVKWVTVHIIDAHRRYQDTLRSPLPAAVASELLAFTDSLKVSERVQFHLAIGELEDWSARLEAIEEITNLPPAERLDCARSRGYISQSPVRVGQEKFIELYRLLEAFYGQLDNPAGNVHAAAMRGRQTAALRADTDNLMIGRAIRCLGRLGL